MRLARLWLLIAALFVFVCVGLVACTGSPYGPSNSGSPAPTSSSGGY